MKLTGSILVIVFHLCQCEKPLSECSATRPFKKINSECTNYTEVCTKVDDPDCSLFRKTCDQCPVTRETVSNKSESVKTWIFLTIIALELVVICCLLMKMKRKFRNPAYTPINQETNGAYQTKNNSGTQLQATLDDLNEKIEKITGKVDQTMITIKEPKISENFHFDKLNDKISSMESNLSVLCEKKTQPKAHLQATLDDLNEKIEKITGKIDQTMITIKEPKISEIHVANLIYPLNIKLPNNEDTIVVNVSVLDNVVKIKQQIASQSPNLLDYKLMKLKYNGTVLENNAYLPTFVGFSQATLLCEIDNKSASNDFVVLKLHGNRPLPELMQVKIGSSIKEMKQLVFKLFLMENVTLYKDSVELTDNSKIEKGKLQDDDTIELIMRETIQVKVNNICDGSKCETIEVTNTSKVDVLIAIISKKMKSDAKNIILLTDGKYLCPDKYIFEYNLSTGSRITFLCIKKFTDKDIQERAKEKNKDKEAVLKSYDISRVTNLIQHGPLINELRRLQICQLHPRFVTLHDVYRDGKTLNVEMEKLDGGSIFNYVTENKSVPESLIVKWSKNILDGLKFLHDHDIIHGDLKPSNLLLDDELNVKLSAFDLYRHETLVGVEDANGLRSRRYKAPEVLSNLPYNKSADVWSFGAILLFLITGKPPNHSQDEDEAVFTIYTTQSIQYDNSNGNMMGDEKEVVDKCLKGDPSDRPSVDKLILDKFFIRIDH